MSGRIVGCIGCSSWSGGAGWSGEWSCSRRSASTGSGTGCRSGRWRGSMTCTAGRCGRRSRRRCRRIARSRRGPRRSGRRWPGGSMRCCGRTWPRRASSGIPPGGSSSGWPMSTTRRCRIRMWPSTWRAAGPRSPRRTGTARRALAGFVPQVREPGAEAEVDFGDVTVELAGQLTRCFLFAFRLSCSGKGVHRVYASQAQEAFLEGHVTAFEVTGGVPFRQIRYDNLSPGGGQGAGRPQPHRDRPVAVVPGLLRVRGVLLPARPRGRA